VKKMSAEQIVEKRRREATQQAFADYMARRDARMTFAARMSSPSGIRRRWY
jgi:hypothetical protein